MLKVHDIEIIALIAIRNNGRKIREAGRAFNIPEATPRKNCQKILSLGLKICVQEK